MIVLAKLAKRNLRYLFMNAINGTTKNDALQSSQRWLSACLVSIPQHVAVIGWVGTNERDIEDMNK